MSQINAVCRSCKSTTLDRILSLGKMPLANSLLSLEQLAEEERMYSLDLAFCSNCTLVQITETVPPEELFREYLYFSSFSDTMLEHAKRLVGHLIEERQLSDSSLVVEVASNDGYLLQYYKEAGIPVLGIEPAVNIAQVAESERGIPTITEFFGETLARTLREQGIRAEILHANNVLAHVADLNGFVAGIEVLLKEAGIAVIEVPYVKDMIEHVEFDTIYHEHLCYFSLTALERLFQRHGLMVLDVEHLPIHGGSLHVILGKVGAGHSSATVKEMLQQEVEWGVERLAAYQRFGSKVEQLRHDLVGILQDLKKEGRRIAAYGASAKGSTLLNYFGIGRETVEYVVDRSPVKQGRYTPGTHLPIYSPERLLADRPDYVLLLTWNFAEEILAQQSEFRAQGGKFIVPIPELRVL